jgi:purine-binding chemotaxis protein CheW
MMNNQDFVLFRIGDFHLALPTSVVRSVERSVLVAALPDAPDPVMGVVNYAGETVPVINLRSKMGLPSHEVDLNDQFIFTSRGELPLALVVDEVSEVITLSDFEIKGSKSFWPGLTLVDSVSGHDGKIIYIQSVDGFLSEDQVFNLVEAMETAGIKETGA